MSFRVLNNVVMPDGRCFPCGEALFRFRQLALEYTESQDKLRFIKSNKSPLETSLALPSGVIVCNLTDINPTDYQIRYLTLKTTSGATNCAVVDCLVGDVTYHLIVTIRDINKGTPLTLCRISRSQIRKWRTDVNHGRLRNISSFSTTRYCHSPPVGLSNIEACNVTCGHEKDTCRVLSDTCKNGKDECKDVKNKDVNANERYLHDDDVQSPNGCPVKHYNEALRKETEGDNGDDTTGTGNHISVVATCYNSNIAQPCEGQSVDRKMVLSNFGTLNRYKDLTELRASRVAKWADAGKDYSEVERVLALSRDMRFIFELRLSKRLKRMKHLASKKFENNYGQRLYLICCHQVTSPYVGNCRYDSCYIPNEILNLFYGKGSYGIRLEQPDPQSRTNGESLEYEPQIPAIVIDSVNLNTRSSFMEWWISIHIYIDPELAPLNRCTITGGVTESEQHIVMSLSTEGLLEFGVVTGGSYNPASPGLYISTRKAKWRRLDVMCFGTKGLQLFILDKTLIFRTALYACCVSPVITIGNSQSGENLFQLPFRDIKIRPLVPHAEDYFSSV